MSQDQCQPGKCFHAHEPPPFCPCKKQPECCPVICDVPETPCFKCPLCPDNPCICPEACPMDCVRPKTPCVIVEKPKTPPPPKKECCCCCPACPRKQPIRETKEPEAPEPYKCKEPLDIRDC